jgi:23S rRNA (guanosine2251-2'-O)-methyltransferase
MKTGTSGYRKKAEPGHLIYGLHAVMEAINAGTVINKILIRKGIQKENFEALREVLKGKDYVIQYVPHEKLDSLTEGNHQGVVAFASPVSYIEIEPFVEGLLDNGKHPCIVVLDRITDVRNLGGIARTALCMGADALVIPSKGAAQVTADAIKTSAGALTSLPVARGEEIKDILFYLQQCGIRLVACTEKSSTPVYKSNLRGPVALIFGSEENGIRSDLMNMCDLKVKIPMQSDMSSLNVGVSVGMVLYEKMRQGLNE